MKQSICPICRAKFVAQNSPAVPFCSERCRKVDLSRWLGEEYSITRIVQEDDEQDDQDDPAQEDTDES